MKTKNALDREIINALMTAHSTAINELLKRQEDAADQDYIKRRLASITNAPYFPNKK